MKWPYKMVQKDEYRCLRRVDLKKDEKKLQKSFYKMNESS